MDRLFTLLAVISALLLLWITLSTGFNIFSRYLGFGGLIWGVQFTEYSLLWMTLLGATWLLRKDKHVTVDIITSALNKRSNAYLRIVHSIMGTLVCGVLAWYGAVVTWGQYQRGVVDIQVIDVPKYLLLIIIPLGFFFLVLEFVRKFFVTIKELKEGKYASTAMEETPDHEVDGTAENRVKGVSN